MSFIRYKNKLLALQCVSYWRDMENYNSEYNTRYLLAFIESMY